MKYLQAILILTVILSVNACNKESSVDNCSKPDITIYNNDYGNIQVTPTLNYDFVEIEYGPNEFSQGNGNKTNNTNITGLSSGSHDFYLRGNCGGSEWSDWSDVKSVYISNGSGPSTNCKKPDNFSNSEGYGQSEGVMSINWDDGNSSPYSGYFELEYGPSGFTIGTGEKATTNNSFYRDGGYTENTAYDVYVRANCGGTDYSPYSDVYSFYASENFNLCLAPKNVLAERNGSNINFSFVPNGEIEYEYTLIKNWEDITDGTLSTLNTSIYAASGGWSSVSSSTRIFYIRAVCRDGGRSDWYSVTIP